MKILNVSRTVERFDGEEAKASGTIRFVLDGESDSLAIGDSLRYDSKCFVVMQASGGKFKAVGYAAAEG